MTDHRAGRIDGEGTRKDSLMAAADWLRLDDRPATTSQKPAAGWEARDEISVFGRKLAYDQVHLDSLSQQILSDHAWELYWR